MPLPRILAGPALRRTDRESIWIWLCTSEALTPTADVHLVNDAHRLGARVGVTDTAASRSFSLSASLHVHLMKVRPIEEFFDHTTVLGYTLHEGEGLARTPLRGYHAEEFGVGPYSFPTFCIQNPRSNALRALFASCRKFHGGGHDATVGMLAQFTAHAMPGAAGRPRMRATAMFLLGDQIYADDVSSMMFPTVTRIAGELGLQSVAEVPSEDLAVPAERQERMYRDAGFTSGEAENHLITLGEYAAMYLLAWNDRVWDELEIGTPAETADRNVLLDSMRGSAAMRTLLANVPTYMIFDDHDVTDDWNINPSWVRHVRTKALGKRIVCNALVTYWAFQGWGNDPDSFDDDFTTQVANYLAASGAVLGFEEIRDDCFEFLNCNRRAHYWSFTAPTVPGAVFLDFRTHRSAARDTAMVDYSINLRDPVAYSFTMSSDALLGERLLLTPPLRVTRMRETRLTPRLGSTRLNGMPPRLLDAALRARGRRLVQSFMRKPMILITGTPVIGASVMDFLQEIAIFKDGSFTWDFENWRGDPESLLDLYELIRYSEASSCIVLSGDVHYASAFIGEIEWGWGSSRRLQRINVAQFTSSATKNSAFPPAQYMRLAQDLLATGDDLACRWLATAPTGGDGNSTSVGRVLFLSVEQMRAFAQVYSLGGVPRHENLPNFVYCDESWHMQTLDGAGMYMRSNFGWLVASNEADQVVSVQIRDAANNVIGDTMRVASTL